MPSLYRRRGKFLKNDSSPPHLCRNITLTQTDLQHNNSSARCRQFFFFFQRYHRSEVADAWRRETFHLLARSLTRRSLIQLTSKLRMKRDCVQETRVSESPYLSQKHHVDTRMYREWPARRRCSLFDLFVNRSPTVFVTILNIEKLDDRQERIRGIFK